MLVHYLTIAAALADAPFAAVTGVLAAAPNPSPAAPPGLEATGNLFIGWMKWILIVAGVGDLLVCGIMMAVGRRNRSAFAADGAAGIPWVLAGLTCGAVAAVVVGAILPS
ncbi:hypothetical protein [Micromonospora sp. NPDC000442]|uniref:hypothetical protein n=1 Tax=Micromonospora sp. NPDC000442 TaxID=3364217 RepID=UPI0036B9D44D